jgi:hypothetical protein
MGTTLIKTAWGSNLLMGAGALHHQWTATAATATPAQGVAAAVVVWTVEGVLVELLAAQSIEWLLLDCPHQLLGRTWRCVGWSHWLLLLSWIGLKLKSPINVMDLFLWKQYGYLYRTTCGGLEMCVLHKFSEMAVLAQWVLWISPTMTIWNMQSGSWMIQNFGIPFHDHLSGWKKIRDMDHERVHHEVPAGHAASLHAVGHHLDPFLLVLAHLPHGLGHTLFAQPQGKHQSISLDF